MKFFGQRIVLRHFASQHKNYDAIIVGGGHNGLTAAAYLQKSGLQVCVSERRPVVGGAAVTEEIVSGFKFSRASYVLSLLRPQIVRDLKLEEFGLRVLPRDPSSYTPLHNSLWKGDARSLTIGTDSEKNAKEISKFSKTDAVMFPKYEKQLARLAECLEPLLETSASNAVGVLHGSLKRRLFCLMQEPGLRASLLKLLALKSDTLALFELLTSPTLSILKKWFESEVLIATLAMDAVIGTMVSPSSPGNGYVLLLYSMLGECDGGKGRWGFPVGGMGAVSNALAASASAMGADIITEQEVSEILLDGDGCARGVRLGSGRELSARVVLSNATPQVTFFDLLNPQSLPANYVAALNSIDYSSGVTKINVAVDKLPSFLADPNGKSFKPKPHHQTTIHINSETIAGLENAHQDALLGRWSQKPLIEMTIPSVLDSTLAPDGCHVVLLFTQYTPYKLKTGQWDEPTKELYASTVFQMIEEYCPGFTDSIVGKEVLTPPDLESIFGLTGGNIFHGAMTPDKLFLLRPTSSADSPPSPYTSVPNLFLCGSGSHPGGGVSGAPGKLAALEVIKYLKQKQ